MERLEIENIFKNSRNSDELFDTFKIALEQKIKDLDLYKILFWNPALSKNEICMFIKKLASVYQEQSYNIYMWGARVLELSFTNDDNFETIIGFYKKAAKSNPLSPEPYLKTFELFNEDLKLPDPDLIINFVKSGITKAKDPSILYYKLGDFYGKLGNTELKKHYISLGEESIKKKFQN